MRIVCPICGEEPKKGQRHFCQPSQVPRQQVELDLVPTPPQATKITSGRRAAPCTSASSVCASVASLVSKTPSVWKSNRALARCGGDDFVAGLLAAAIGMPGWHKDAKRALISVCVGQVAHEAARAVQDFWRRVLKERAAKAPRRTAGTVNGYQQLLLTKAQPAAQPTTKRSAPASERQIASKTSVTATVAKARPPALSLESGPPAIPGLGSSGSAGSGGSVGSGATAAPRQPSTPRNKSNPRPTGCRAVPINPIQAMKQRREQQQQEAEERRLQQLQEAEDMRLARRGGGAASNSQPPSPQHASELEEVAAAQSLVLQTAAALPMLALELQQSSSESQIALHDAEGYMPTAVRSPAKQLPVATAARPAVSAELTAKPPLPAEFAIKVSQSTELTAKPSLPADVELPGPEAVLTPLERRQLRQAKTNSPHANESQPQLQIQPPAQGAEAAQPETPRSSVATERLRDRIRQRDTSGRSSEARSSSRPPAGAAGSDSWKERIEARQREEQELQVQEQTEKQRTDERSRKRNDATRRVMERQAQRQAELVSLEA